MVCATLYNQLILYTLTTFKVFLTKCMQTCLCGEVLNKTLRLMETGTGPSHSKDVKGTKSADVSNFSPIWILPTITKINTSPGEGLRITRPGEGAYSAPCYLGSRCKFGDTRSTSSRSNSSGGTRSIKGGHCRLLVPFFPCNAHRANVEMPKSKGGTVPQCPPRSAAYEVKWRHQCKIFALFGQTCSALL